MKKKYAFLAILFIAAVFSLRGFGFIGSYYFVIPIEFLNSYQIPCASIEIEGNKYQVEIDLGSKMALSLHKDVLEKMKKDSCGTSRRIDFRGNKYETPLYFIPEVKVGTFFLKKIKAREESVSFATKGSILTESEEQQNAGRIGRDFFAGKNLFMDFNHCILIACSKLKDIEREGYEIKNLTSIPFQNTSDGIVLEVETDIGKRKFVLDTGTTISAIRSGDLKEIRIKQRNGRPIIETSKFVMDGMDFGSRKLYLLDISREFNEMDGLLGMDFLKEHVVYLDFVNKVAYIGKSSDTKHQ